ncbi:MAG TPA: methyl-accepting chemotaxis protein, partial [Rhodocyclaceae bacterium]|nr:methyl-accepting chemotaxis protein [Rhodocyclaceae bacterium]
PWPAVAASTAALAALLAWQIERLIFRPLDGLRRTMLDCQADGNLKRRARIFRDDDLGQLAKTFNALMLTMRSVTREVHNEAGEVSQEIAGLAEFGSEVQANSAAQYDATMAAAASLEEFTTCSSTIADAARDVKQAAMASRDLIVGGHQRVEAFRTELDSIAGSVDAIDRAAAELAARTAEITKMVDHVRDIADQTNLLALNAAIEAARAGEHGRGFAVVADEVRKLAGTSGATAAQIRQTTESIVSSTGAVKKVVDSTLDRVRRGEESMVEVARVLADSKSQFEVTHKGIMEISLATNEQASTGNAIAQSFEAISRRGEENDRAMRSLAKLADRSNARARALTELVADFK